MKRYTQGLLIVGALLMAGCAPMRAYDTGHWTGKPGYVWQWHEPRSTAEFAPFEATEVPEGAVPESRKPSYTGKPGYDWRWNTQP
jgi:hypothetical protein